MEVGFEKLRYCRGFFISNFFIFSLVLFLDLIYEGYALGKFCRYNVQGLSLVTNIFPDGKISRPRLAVFALSSAQTKTSLRLTKTKTHEAVRVLFCHFVWSMVRTLFIRASFWYGFCAFHHEFAAHFAELARWFCFYCVFTVWIV